MTTRFADKPEPGALATQVLPPSDYGGTVQPPPRVPTIVTGGTPGWQIVLIAVAAAVIAATVAVILDRARAARRRLTAPTARACTPRPWPRGSQSQPRGHDMPAMPRHPSGLQTAAGATGQPR